MRQPPNSTRDRRLNFWTACGVFLGRRAVACQRRYPSSCLDTGYDAGRMQHLGAPSHAGEGAS